MKIASQDVLREASQRNCPVVRHVMDAPPGNVFLDNVLSENLLSQCLGKSIAGKVLFDKIYGECYTRESPL